MPVVIILKALRDTSDREIHERVLQGQKENTFLAAHVEVWIRLWLAREQHNTPGGGEGGARRLGGDAIGSSVGAHRLVKSLWNA